METCAQCGQFILPTSTTPPDEVLRYAARLRAAKEELAEMRETLDAIDRVLERERDDTTG